MQDIRAYQPLVVPLDVVLEVVPGVCVCCFVVGVAAAVVVGGAVVGNAVAEGASYDGLAHHQAAVAGALGTCDDYDDDPNQNDDPAHLSVIKMCKEFKTFLSNATIFLISYLYFQFASFEFSN